MCHTKQNPIIMSEGIVWGTGRSNATVFFARSSSTNSGMEGRWRMGSRMRWKSVGWLRVSENINKSRPMSAKLTTIMTFSALHLWPLQLETSQRLHKCWDECFRWNRLKVYSFWPSIWWHWWCDRLILWKLLSFFQFIYAHRYRICFRKKIML